MAASTDISKCSFSINPCSLPNPKHTTKHCHSVPFTGPSIISPSKFRLHNSYKKLLVPISFCSDSNNNGGGGGGGGGGGISPILLERPSFVPKRDGGSSSHHETTSFLSSEDEEDDEEDDDVVKPINSIDEIDASTWIDWEDEILGETQPILALVRAILHSNWYQCGDRLKPEHEKIILERLLPYHPDSERKMRGGVEYVTVDYHPEFGTSRCLFIHRKDGEIIDFSYWKCLRGFVWKKYPLFAEVFIKKHLTFRRS